MGREAAGGAGSLPLDPLSLTARVRGRLAGRARRVVEPGDRTSAAVLVLFVYRGGEPHLVFAKRTETVPHHRGQVAFPGGVIREADGSPVATALREAAEEVGLDPGAVEVLGLFDDSPTHATPFVITPVLGLCREAPAFRADGQETERVLEVPLRHLLDPATFHEEWWEREGRRHRVGFFRCGEDVVWGATARILRELLDALFPEAGARRAAAAGPGAPP
ncbi:MAG: CoA pyrophosphatase [Armatimonadota bacterium]|nr:CoA pyrophosphatase [Armatimonadota bacterium]